MCLLFDVTIFQNTTTVLNVFHPQSEIETTSCFSKIKNATLQKLAASLDMLLERDIFSHSCTLSFHLRISYIGSVVARGKILP